MKKDLIFAPIMLVIGVVLCLLKVTGITAHIAISVLGIFALAAPNGCWLEPTVA